MLQLILDDFAWQRPASLKKGFTWEGTGNAMHLVWVPGAACSSYQPHPGIFRDFAGVEPTPAAVLKFANRYGPLQERLEFNSFPFWQMGIQHMGELVKLSDALTGGDWEKIPRALAPFLANASLASASDIRLLHQKQKRGENISQNEQVNSAVLRLYQAIAPVERLVAEGSFNSFTGNAELRVKPTDLLGFMFFQLGRAVIGGRRFRQCRVCGKWSLLTPGVNRADRITCSGYCRLKAYRRRMARAVELHRQGWGLKKIAKEIGSSVAQVEKWVSQAKT